MLERDLVADWYRLHRAKHPMQPKDPDDRVLGWVYAICSHWRQSKACLTEWELRQGKSPREETIAIGYATTLNDARTDMEISAVEYEARCAMMYRRTGPNRFYASDGEQMHTLCVVPIEDDDPENIF